MLRDYPCVLDPQYTPPPAPPDWKVQALDALADLAASGQSFTSVDLWAILEARGTPPPPEPRAMGSIITTALARRMIRPTGEFVTTQLHQSNPMPRRQYRGQE